MNQIYKVIWSRVKHCYVVVSEIVDRCGKNGAVSENKSLPFRAFLCAFVLIGCLMPVNMSYADGENALKWGTGASADGKEDIAMGKDAKAASTGTSPDHTGNNIAVGSNAKATGPYHDIAIGSSANVEGSSYGIAVGHAARVGGTAANQAIGGIAIGGSSGVTNKHGIAIGDQTKVSGLRGVSIGMVSYAEGEASTALGMWSKAKNDYSVALGSYSDTANTVSTASGLINGRTYNFAGGTALGTVSVGKTGAQEADPGDNAITDKGPFVRTITNVAAGRILGTSTDAINGSQLYAVTTEMDKGVAYAGDVKGAGAADNKFTRKLGEQTNIVGGVADASKLTDGNIGVVSNGTDTLNIKLAKNVKVDSVTTGNTVINNNGLTVGGKTYVTNNGINANNQKVTNVADGQVAAGSKDAVNGGQLHDAKNEVIKKGLRFDADNNSEKTNKLGSKVTVPVTIRKLA